MTGQQRGDQREERVKAGGQVGVHVGDDVRLAAAPDMAERESAALAVQMHRPDPGKFPAHTLSYPESTVSAGIIGDGDDELKGKVVGQIRVQQTDALLEDFLLVVYRDGDLDEALPRSCGRRLDVVSQQQRTRRFSALIVGHAWLRRGKALLMPLG